MDLLSIRNRAQIDELKRLREFKKKNQARATNAKFTISPKSC